MGFCSSRAGPTYKQTKFCLLLRGHQRTQNYLILIVCHCSPGLLEVTHFLNHRLCEMGLSWVCFARVGFKPRWACAVLTAPSCTIPRLNHVISEICMNWKESLKTIVVYIFNKIISCVHILLGNLLYRKERVWYACSRLFWKFWFCHNLQQNVFPNEEILDIFFQKL